MRISGNMRRIAKFILVVLTILIILIQVAPRPGSIPPRLGEMPSLSHGTGFLPPEGRARRTLASVPKVERPSEPVPTGSVRWDLSSHFPPVGDQGAQGSCAAWSVNYYQNGFLQRVIHGWTDDSPEHLMSPAWTYNKANHGRNYGSSVVENILILMDLGSATMATMPYDELDFSFQGGYRAWREAPQFRVGGFEVIDISTPGGVAALKERLARGLLATIVIDAFALQPSFSDGNFVVSSAEYRSTYANHAQTIVGFDDSVRDDGDVGAFRVVNSWGSSWGDNGFYWITYKALYSRVSLGWRYAYVLLPMSWTPYQPKLLAYLDLEASSSAVLNFTVENESVSVALGTGGWSIDGKVVVDLTELYKTWSSGGYPGVNLTVGQGVTIRSFRIECHLHGYLGPWQTSPESPDVPFSGPGTIRSQKFSPSEKAAFAEIVDDPVVVLPNGGSIKLRIGNAGNCTSTLTAYLSSNWSISPSTISISLEPGESEEFDVSVFPAGGMEASATIDLRAEVEGGPGLEFTYLALSGYRGIRISGNSQLREVALELGWPGTGTSQDPIRIENISLFGGALEVLNTSLHVLIRNVSVSWSTKGIHLAASNFTIADSLVSNVSGPGILITDSYDFTIRNCTVVMAHNSAIWIRESEDFRVSGNQVVGTSEGGIFVERSTGFSILDNRLEGVGIVLWGGPDTYSSSSIEGNTVNGLPFVFVRDQRGIVIEGELGGLLIYNSTEILVRNALISGSSTAAFVVSSSNIRISDSSFDANSWNGIYAGYVSGLEIENVTLSGNAYYGLWAFRSSDLEMRDSSLSENYEGAVFQDCDQVSLYNSSFGSNFWAGIWAENTSIMRILKSEMIGNYIGIDLENSKDVEIAGSSVGENDASGILLANASPVSILHSDLLDNKLVSLQISFSNNITLEDSGISSSGEGVVIALSNHVFVRYCNISQNEGYGLLSLGSSGVSIISTTFSSNGLYAIYLKASSGCSVYSNSFISNRGSGNHFDPSRVQAYDDSSNSWNSEDGGNYWEDWAMNNDTNDENGDGIVDYPYPLDGGSLDLLPLKYPPQAGVEEFPKF